MKRLAYLFLVSLFVSVGITSCTYVPYSKIAPVISFDYMPFKNSGLEISPYDAPRDGYILLGNVSRVYTMNTILGGMAIDQYSSAEMSVSQQSQASVQYITEQEIEVATMRGADAIFSFSVKPNTLSGAYNDYNTTSYIVDYVLARKVNADGSFVNEKVEVVKAPIHVREHRSELDDSFLGVIDSTRCLAILPYYNGEYEAKRQCQVKPSKSYNNGYCIYHQSHAE